MCSSDLRGNDRVMVRGTFANIRIRNFLAPGTEGGVTKYLGTGTATAESDADIGKVMPIYDASVKYKASGTALVVLAGAEYGTGSSRDWAAKGTRLLGVRAVIARSYERIHRSNLVGMGVLPLQFLDGVSAQTLGLKGDEQITIHGLGDTLKPRQDMEMLVKYADGATKKVPLLCRILTLDELDYFRHGGIMQYVLRQLAA